MAVGIRPQRNQEVSGAVVHLIAKDTARVAQMELIPDQLVTTREGDPSAGAKHLFFVFVVLNQSAVSVGYGQRPLNVKQLRVDFRINR